MAHDADLKPVLSAPESKPDDRNIAEPSPRAVLWHRTILGFCFGVFAVEVGLCLVAFPWLGSWDLNWVPLRVPELRHIWLSTWMRGAITGLGLVNIYVGLAEVFGRLRHLLSARRAKMGRE